MRYDTTVEINQPAEEVFRFVADFGYLPRYTKVSEARLLDAQGLAVGARLEEVFRVGPWRWRLVARIEEFEPGRLIGYRSISSRLVSWHGRLFVDPLTPGTSRVRAVGDVRLRGPLRLLEPLFAGELQRNEAEEMANLRRLLDGSAAELQSQPAAGSSA